MENDSAKNAEIKETNGNLKVLQPLLAYALLGWMLATVSAIVFIPNLYGGGTADENAARNTQVVIIILIVLCSVFGAGVGMISGLLLMPVRQKEKFLPIILAPFFGIIWGIVLGAIVGFPIFFIGGLFLGWMVAVPLGFVGFTLFAVVYELLANYCRLRWWHIVFIETGVICLALGYAYYFLKINGPGL